MRSAINLISNVLKEETYDTITMDVPLFIRLLEFSREEIADDAALHVLATNALKASTTLTMNAYDSLIKGVKTK